jgi:hypothetical protein
MSRIDSASPYRVQGPVTSFAKLAKTKPGFAIPATPEQIEELKLHEQQSQAREAAAVRYAEQHPDKIYAQVIVNGSVFATVYDSGSAGTQYAIPGLSEDGSGLALAKKRLDEIVQAVQGRVVYDNFVPPLGPPPSTVPESALPQVTARNLADMARDMDRALARSRMAAEDATKK